VTDARASGPETLLNVDIIDENYKHAAYWALFGAVASYFGVVHSTRFAFGASPSAALGYLLIALLCGYCAYRTRTAATSG